MLVKRAYTKVLMCLGILAKDQMPFLSSYGSIGV